MKTKLILTMGGRGGCGKTTALVAIADYLQSAGVPFSAVDCDMENASQGTCFNHWLRNQAVALDLRLPLERDRLLTDAAESGAPYVLVDLPANSTGDLAVWLKDVATRSVIDQLDLELIAVGVVTPEAASAASVVKWIDTLGDRGQYLIVLNQRHYNPKKIPPTEQFAHWFDVALPMILPTPTITILELPHMEFHAMEILQKKGTLPNKALADGKLPLLIKARVKTWVGLVADQLESSGLFSEQLAETK